MTVLIKPDGAAKRFAAAKENVMASKEEMVVRSKNLRAKIELANITKSLKEHPGWKALEVWYTNKWSFKNIMNVFRSGDEKAHRDMMTQREALTMIEDILETWIRNGDTAQHELAEEERVK